MSPINSLWFKWKSLKLPWRRTFLAGKDLNGNTFWEFKDALNSKRLRRIVKYNPKTHLADVKVSPQWHQWLRYTRQEPPTIQEQQNDLLRQERMKHLAKLADERWASKPSFLDRPQGQQSGPTTKPSHEPHHSAAQPDQPAGVQNTIEKQPVPNGQGNKNKSPWARETGGPSEKWQPESWNPTPKGR
ncbi:hypothetical protein RJZ56_000411 [Blastomyces dermatitidis]|uniref:Uncharacterized protein n=3 Tax=Blastomyces TaxID=229219 RepID=A0A179UFU7_BLAGS|nr:hypothetical protein, variant [Blastomyces gilchristii SLH14081]XP_045275417.1 hypothetical protein, variant [Blastomyces dermatitidis ER-3]EGE77594.1 hypothetical protein BDDG_00531 [Blastomyces dermatitidis ATCC 18188]EQL33683.1 hypothetical protein, variant [Blastomyces dermatitidis ATCC 26199]EEQ88247.1 hypothetical protein, variant [Blastomyces dermatitidis ER-3]OAT05881.1 hypothetical protein, variant [Blastomyces gilchristii SLH14081]